MRRFVLPLICVALALSALAFARPWSQAPAAKPAAMETAVTMEWLSWSHFRFTSVDGRVILTNPFVSNPDSPIKVEDIAKADLILVPDGHGDEVGQTVDIAKRTGARVLAAGGVARWLMEQEVPMAQVTSVGPGSRFRLGGVTVRPLLSVHGSELGNPTPRSTYGGIALSFMLTFEDGWTVYFGASSAATSDMALWGSMYKPHAAILVMTATTEPTDFATSVRLLQNDNPNLSMVVPHHHRLSPPPGATSVADVQAAVDALGLGIQVTPPALGQVMGGMAPQ